MKSKTQIKFWKFMNEYLDVFHSPYWDELDLDYKKQGYTSLSKEDVNLIYKLVLLLESKNEVK